MKAATLVGILLIVLGIAGFAMGGISFTHEKKDVDLGPVHVSHQEKNTLPISPILSLDPHWQERLGRLEANLMLVVQHLDAAGPGSFREPKRSPVQPSVPDRISEGL